MNAARCLQIMTTSANLIMRDWILTIITNMLMTYTVFCVVGTIKVHHIVPFLPLTALLLDALVGAGALILLYMELGEYHEASKKFLGSWKRCTKTVGKDRKILGKYLRSCRILRFEMGSMGYFQKASSKRIIAKIIFYVNKVLMLTKGIKV